jgi:hypothetical protein
VKTFVWILSKNSASGGIVVKYENIGSHKGGGGGE